MRRILTLLSLFITVGGLLWLSWVKGQTATPVFACADNMCYCGWTCTTADQWNQGWYAINSVENGGNGVGYSGVNADTPADQITPPNALDIDLVRIYYGQGSTGATNGTNIGASTAFTEAVKEGIANNNLLEVFQEITGGYVPAELTQEKFEALSSLALTPQDYLNANAVKQLAAAGVAAYSNGTSPSGTGEFPSLSGLNQANTLYRVCGAKQLGTTGVYQLESPATDSCIGSQATGGCAYILACDCDGNGGNEKFTCVNSTRGNDAGTRCSQNVCTPIGSTVPALEGGSKEKICEPGQMYNCDFSSGTGTRCNDTGTGWAGTVRAHACGSTVIRIGFYGEGGFDYSIPAGFKYLTSGGKTLTTNTFDASTAKGYAGFVGCGGPNNSYNCYTTFGSTAKTCIYEPGLSCGARGDAPPPANEEKVYYPPVNTTTAPPPPPELETPPPPPPAPAVCKEACGSAAGGKQCAAGLTCLEGKCYSDLCAPSEQDAQCKCKPPEVAPICIDLIPSKQNPQLGDSVTYTCAKVTGADRYEFRVGYTTRQEGYDDVELTNLEPASATSNVSKAVTVNKPGRYIAQCRPCGGNNLCAPWEPLNGIVPDPTPTPTPAQVIATPVPTPLPTPQSTPVVTPTPIPDNNTTQQPENPARIALIGDGSDGDLVVNGSFDLNTAASNGRTAADGVAYFVNKRDAKTWDTKSIVKATTVAPPVTGLTTGDEVMIFCSDKPWTGYEFKKVASAANNTITLQTDVAINTSECEKVLIQRVPHYKSVTLDSNDIITASKLESANGASGMVVFRSQGPVRLTGSSKIDLTGKGYRGGTPYYGTVVYDGDRSYTRGTINPDMGPFGTGAIGVNPYPYNLGGGGGGGIYLLKDVNMLAAIIYGTGGGAGGSALDAFEHACYRNGGVGGAGGGIVMVFAPSIEIATPAVIEANGQPGLKPAGGGGPCNTYWGQQTVGGGGGGGAGGGILLVGIDTLNLGNNGVRALPGDGAVVVQYQNGAKGSDGAVQVFSLHVSGTSTPAFKDLGQE